MSFEPIPLKSGRTIASLSEAREMISRFSDRERTTPHWVCAVAEIDSATQNPEREARARKAVYAALRANSRVI
jgi:hypothetical protein